MNIYKKITSNSGLVSFGNTGARLSDPRAIYVKILSALVEFRKQNANWENADQIDFGKLLTELDIFDIKTNNVVSSDKDVRVKTSFISQLGFTTEERVVTNIGRELIENSQSYDINNFEISKDSYTYLKQFLKYQQNDFKILPLLSLIYSVIEFENKLPIDFVTYIWASSQTKEELVQNIEIYKLNSDYREVVYKVIAGSESTKTAQENIELFSKSFNVSDTEKLSELLYEIFPHGKGNSFKDKTIGLFYDIYLYWKNKNQWNKTEKRNFIQNRLKSRYKDISSKKPSFYLEILFDTTLLNNSSDWNTIISFFEKTSLITSKTEKDFILNFHILYMYIKKLSVCEEYRDLNTRHLKLLDIFIFEYDNIKLDIVFWYLFKSVKNNFLSIEPISSNLEYRKHLETNHKEIGDVYDFLKINFKDLSAQIATDFPEIKKLGLQNFTQKKKEERLLNLINNIFTKENIITIFENIYPRNDKKIRDFIKDKYQEYEATIPALFEYLLGISLYWLSGKEVKLSNILNSNLDANLLPKTHMGGGQADVIVSYKDKDYLIEATLSDNDGQRKMEAEPVPRHLAKHISEVNPNSLALFVAGQLDRNNLVVLRNYKFSPWYYSDEDFVDSMDILPLSVSNMIYLLKNENNFELLQDKFTKLLNSDTRDGFKWYKEEINTIFTNGN